MGNWSSNASIGVFGLVGSDAAQRQAAKALLGMLYLLAVVAILLMALGGVWFIVRWGRGLRLRLPQRRPKVKYFDLRGETNIDDPDDPPHEPSSDERQAGR